MITPENHYGLEAKQKLLEVLQQDISSYEAKFTPLHEQFTLLEKYEKPVPDSVSCLCTYQRNKNEIFLDTCYACTIRRTLATLSSMFD
jgi:hypothetical protein